MWPIVINLNHFWFYSTVLNMCDHIWISLWSFSLHTDGRWYELHVSLNIWHSERYLNMGSVFCVPCSFIRDMVSLCFTDVLRNITRTSNFLNNVISLFVINFLFYITIKRTFLSVINNYNLDINLEATSDLLQAMFTFGLWVC